MERGSLVGDRLMFGIVWIDDILFFSSIIIMSTIEYQNTESKVIACWVCTSFSYTLTEFDHLEKMSSSNYEQMLSASAFFHLFLHPFGFSYVPLP